MEELIEFSKSVVRSGKNPDGQLAKTIAEWALPGDWYNELEKRFERSGLSLQPFIDLVSLARTFDASGSENAYEFYV